MNVLLASLIWNSATNPEISKNKLLEQWLFVDRSMGSSRLSGFPWHPWVDSNLCGQWIKIGIKVIVSVCLFVFCLIKRFVEKWYGMSHLPVKMGSLDAWYRSTQPPSNSVVFRRITELWQDLINNHQRYTI